MNKWEQAQWQGTTDPKILAQFDAYRIKYRRGYVWLRVYKTLFLGCKYHYTSSMGANSEDSFSGCLTDNTQTLNDAQSAVIAKVCQINQWT